MVNRNLFVEDVSMQCSIINDLVKVKNFLIHFRWCFLHGTLWSSELRIHMFTVYLLRNWICFAHKYLNFAMRHFSSCQSQKILTWQLFISFLQGMMFLHSSAVVCHGNLKSTKCLVDSRFVLQISGFGLYHFRKSGDADSLKGSDKYYRGRLSYIYTMCLVPFILYVSAKIWSCPRSTGALWTATRCSTIVYLLPGANAVKP